MRHHIRKLMRDRRGVAALEYGIIAAAMIVIALTTSDIGLSLKNMVEQVDNMFR